jgi:glycyl-tRNA synthetase beta chain
MEGLAARLGTITFFAGAGTFADKAARLVELVGELGGDASAREAARLAKADQAAELVREFPDLEGVIGAEYARLAGVPEQVCVAIAEQYLPDGGDAPLPSSEAGRILSAADKIDTLRISFGLGHRPTGSRDPYGLRRAAIGVCRLAIEGGAPVRRELFDGELREFVEERLEGLVDVPVEFVRAARGADLADLAGVAALARDLADLGDRLAVAREMYERARRIVGDQVDGLPVDPGLLTEREMELARAVSAQPRGVVRADTLIAWADAIAPTVDRFFVDVLVMDPDERLRSNRLRLLRDLRDALGRLGDLAQIPL